MCFVCQLIQRRKADIVANTLVQYNGLVISVLGGVSNAVFNSCRNVIDLRSVCQYYLTFTVIGSTEDCFSNLMHTGF